MEVRKKLDESKEETYQQLKTLFAKLFHENIKYDLFYIRLVFCLRGHLSTNRLAHASRTCMFNLSELRICIEA